MRKHKFNRPLTVALSEIIYTDVKRLSDKCDISMGQWVRDSLAIIIKERSKDLNEMIND